MNAVVVAAALEEDFSRICADAFLDNCGATTG